MNYSLLGGWWSCTQPPVRQVAPVSCTLVANTTCTVVTPSPLTVSPSSHISVTSVCPGITGFDILT